MEVGGKQSAREQSACEKCKIMEERCDVVAEKEKYEAEAVITKYEVVTVQCELLSVARNPKALAQHGTVEDVKGIQEETELTGKDTPI